MKGKGIERYWGYLLLPVLAYVWLTPEIAAGVAALLSGMIIVYFLIGVPVWCGAVTREGTLCRRNSYGLLFGCSFRQHKWQRLRMAVVPEAWRRINRGLWASPSTALATFSTMVGIVSGLAALIRMAFGG
jgi:hypothetical protein